MGPVNMQSTIGQPLWGVGAVDGTARIALLIVVVLLVAIVAAVAALAIVMRKRTARPAEVEPTPDTPTARVARASTPMPSRPRRAPSHSGVAGGGGALAVATSGMVCPTCRTEYAGLTYCTRDARRLVPAEEMLAGGRSSGGVCVSCRRAYEPGLRRCPHDGGELVPATVAAALRGRKPNDTATGVLAKNCPACRQRFDLAARFCGHDGTELVVVN
jgi:hypothetical protein